MSNEIATYSMILSKLSLGKSGTECPTKTQILAINSLIVIENASTYGANECVKIDDIRKKVETWNYYLTVSPTSMSFGAGGGSKSFTVSSYKRKVLDGVEQSGDTSVSLKSTVISGSGFSLSGTTVSASANESTSNRTGTVTITQNESNKTATISLSQSGDTISTTYTFSINPYKVNVGSSGGSGSVTISSYKTVGSSTYDVDYSIDSSTLPSWASFNKSTSTFTIQSTTSTTGRTAKVYFDQDESGKRDYAELTQTGYTPPADNYVFTWGDGSTSDVSASFPWDFSTNGTAANIPVVSTKNGSSQSWRVSSEPSWIVTSTTSSKVIINVSDNSGSARSGEIVLTQDGSGKTLTVNVSQDAKPAEDEYTFEIRKSDEEYTGKTSITFDVPARTVGWSGNYAYRSRKNGEQFANVSFSSSASWLHVESSGAYTVYHNTGSSSRSGTITLTQAESGLECYIVINQAGYTPTYTFNATPTNLVVDAITNTYSFTVNSSKTILNDDGSESSERIGWTGTDDANWIYLINASNRPNQIGTVTNETTLQRTAKITLTQDGTGIQAFVNVIQEAGVESNNELYIDSINYDSVHLFGNGEVPHLGSQNYFLVLTKVPIPWKTSKGLAVNGGTVYAGDTISVYVSSNNSYTLLRTFALETGVQRVIV